MASVDRRCLLWDMLEGRAPAPPAARLLGWKLVAIDPEQGTIRVEFTATADFLNPIGTVQGGLLAAMLDERRRPLRASWRSLPHREHQVSEAASPEARPVSRRNSSNIERKP